MADHRAPVERHPIADDHDLVLVVTVWKDDITVKRHEFEVATAKLSHLEYFQKFRAAGLSISCKTKYHLPESFPVAWKIWLKALHGYVDVNMSSVDSLTVWRVLFLGDKYKLGLLDGAIQEWFNTWFPRKTSSLSLDTCRELLYPCYAFDHAKGFAKLTKRLAYHGTGYISEKRPDGFGEYYLRLDQRIIQQINAARGRLKSVLHGHLYDPIYALLERARCKYKKQVLWAFHEALIRSQAWPVEIKFGANGMNELCERLRLLTYHDPHPKGECTDPHWCSRNFESIVAEGVDDTEQYFDGLCLDCIKHSKSGDEDEDYWYHARRSGPRDVKCRISHGHPTWYFSFMGRKEKMDLFKGRKHTF